MKVTSKKTITPFTYQPSKGTIFTQKSKTIQGEAYTIQQLMERAVNGGHLAGAYEPVYLDQPIESEIQQMVRPGMDITEITELKNFLVQREKELTDRLNTRQVDPNKSEERADKTETSLTTESETKSTGDETKKTGD